MIATAAITAAVSSLFTLIGNSETTKKAGGEFLDATWTSIKPWFIKEDDTPETKAQIEYAIKEVQEKKELTPLTEPVLRPRLEAHLTEHPNDLATLQDIISEGQTIIDNSQTLDQRTINVNNEGATIGKQFTGNTFNGGQNFS